MPWMVRILAGLGLAFGMSAASLPIRVYTTVQGLAHDHVNRIYLDSRGFLWICTDEGLSRFDGNRFVNYTLASGLPHMHVNDMLETRGGEYWIATDAGVARFYPNGRPKRFVTLAPAGPPEALRINALAEDRDRSILLATSAGVYRLTPSGADGIFELLPLSFPKGVHEASKVNSLHVDQHGVVWVGAVSGLYRRGQDGSWNRIVIGDSSHDFVNSVVEDPEGKIWICTRQHGFGRLVGVQGNRAILDSRLDSNDGLHDPDIRALWFSSDGRRWAGTSSGLVEWSKRGRFEVLSTRQGLSDDSIYALAEDPARNLWIGTRRGGLMCLGRADWSTFNRSDRLSLSHDEMLLETRAGEICVADLSDGRRPMRCLDGDRFDEIVPPLPAKVVRSPTNSSEMVIHDRSGAWWISTGQGVYLFPNSGWARDLPRSHPLQLRPDVQTTRLYEDASGDVWIAIASAARSGLLRWQRSSGKVHDESDALPAQLAGVRISAIVEAPAGQLWVGLGSAGELLRKRNGRFEPVVSPLLGRISELYVDHLGRLWIASLEGGLGRIDDPTAASPKVQLLTASQGLSSNEIWCIVEDNLGRIYVGNVRGVDRIDPKTSDVLRYTEADGLVGGDIRSALRDRTGNLWFLSNRGASRFRPARDLALAAARPRITGLRISGNSWPISELGEVELGPLQLSWRQNSLTMEFGAIDYNRPSRPLYQYRLEGASGDWSGPTPDPSVTFANLSPGRYRFVARNASSGDPRSSVAAVQFTVLPPVWRRWWFHGLIAMFAAAIVYGLHRIQLERKVALERVRSNIAMDLHDDLGASLARMAVIGEVMKANVNQNDVESQLMLSDIAETSRRLVDGMRDIVWSIDPRHDQAGDTIYRLREFASTVLEAKGIRWQLDAAPGVASNKLSAEQRRHLYLVCKEAIHNIARHSKARTASVRLGIERGMFQAVVEDDGCGIPSEDGHGLGLRSMRTRVAALGGTLDVSTSPILGTRITFRFPLRSKNA